MFDVGGGELILIVLAIILLFGPQKIPEIAKMVSKGMKKVRDAQSEFQGQINDLKTEFDSAVSIDPVKQKPRRQPVRNIEKPAPKADENTVKDVDDFYKKQAEHSNEFQNNAGFTAVKPKTSGEKIENTEEENKKEVNKDNNDTAYPDYDPVI
eukprot:Anaeramoba_ignava/a351443_19.p3 GENE.a351443_19~~a351443_19.p3  ORF type:complete len:153 (+),score=11.88 a351443_19:1228-1686(+)